MYISISVDDVLNDSNMDRAMFSLNSKHDSCGIDGVKLSELPQFLRNNKDRIYEEIRTGAYTPGLVESREILMKGGKKRRIATMNSIDRLVARAIVQVLAEALEPYFSEHSYAYRKGMGAADAASAAAKYIEQGYFWVSELDIRHFFDSIPYAPLLDVLEKSVSGTEIIRIIRKFILCQVVEDGVIQTMQRGLIQGLPLSPVLSNLYLNDLDQYLLGERIPFYRYGDDINTYADTYEEAFSQRKKVTLFLEGKGLFVNEEKGGVYLGKNRSCLGFQFEEKQGRVFLHKIIKNKSDSYQSWKRSSIRKIDQNYHIVNDGILTRKDFTILFENDEGKRYLPAEAIDSLNIYSNVSFSGSFFEYVGRLGVIVSLFNPSGEKIGSFIPNTPKKNYQIEANQISLIQNPDEHLKAAKKYQNANLFNLRAILRYYERRNHNPALQAVISQITGLLGRVNEAKTINMLMMYEAQARQAYYQCFNDILQVEGFHYKNRTRRPPRDAINALISFGNTLLYQRFAWLLYQSQLDIRFGILHNSRHRAESLNLDLADLFKPVLVDRTIFTVINRRMIKAETDFQDVENEGVYLNKKGKRIFLNEFENKLQQKVKGRNGKKSYDDLMQEEVRKLDR